MLSFLLLINIEVYTSILTPSPVEDYTTALVLRLVFDLQPASLAANFFSPFLFILKINITWEHYTVNLGLKEFV